MKATFIGPIVLISLTGILPVFSHSLNAQADSLKNQQYKVVVAGSHYATSEKHQKRWGKHYRQEWNTAVKVKIAMLDTLAGGVEPYQEGGGRQSKTLRLKDKKGKEWVLRSIDKSFDKALPEIAQGTFIEAIANDQVSIAHPYAAVTIPPMMEAAGIYHAIPRIFYIPKQRSLGKYSEEYGDRLYLFEQRPDENWEEAANFGFSKNIIGTEKLQEKLLQSPANRVDQPAFVRARLFDFIVGDWSRHEDQWRWAAIEQGSQTLYQPIPRDRDQVYTKFDGTMVTRLFSIAGFDHLQSFENKIEDIHSYNFPARNLDRLVANETTKELWLSIAGDLQRKLTDQVIENAIRQLPPEVFPISGLEIIGKLKSRRDHLHKYAEAYYLFLAHYVDIPGTNEAELFEIERLNNASTRVDIYKLDKEGKTGKSPYYSRTFITAETREIRLYGMDGNDKFLVSGKADQSSLIRIVPGPGADSVNDQSSVSSGGKMTRVYDNERPAINKTAETSVRVTKNDELNNYQYTHFEYDKKGFIFRPGITLGVGYRIENQKWRKHPYGTGHRFMVYYGPNRGAVAGEYRYIANQLIGNWNLEGLARLDIPFVAHYFGTGNETLMDASVNRRFYRYRALAVNLGFNLNRLIDSTHFFSWNNLVQAIDIKNDADRFVGKNYSVFSEPSMTTKYFAATELVYQFKKTDHPIVPTRGVVFNLSGGHTFNLKEAGKDFSSYASSFSVYLPFFRVFSLALRAGGSAITGEPEFYQLATLSGKENLRGHRRQRFYGKTSFYNNNELRLILPTSNRLFNGSIGLLAFVDQGRVWQPGEKSERWHVGYGGGFFVAPFNKILLNASYGLSSEDRVLHLRLGFLF
ncbi:MAG TPA: BamA/TamA family outer membrane protein [Chitinophagaceae bacterium]|nr:BamA/TamA family outer membrane protein [Chitinophagaceae bacterium]